MSQFNFDALEAEIPHLRRYARSLTRETVRADDLVQDCLERAISRCEQFQVGTNLRSWLFTILRNVHIDECRKNQRRGPAVPLEDWHGDVAAEPRQEWALELREFGRSFDQLRKDERDILLRVAVDGQSYEEIAEHLDIAVGTVKSRLSRARQRLRQWELNAYERQNALLAKRFSAARS